MFHVSGVRIYPMEKGDTPVTSFAFNAILMLVGAITVTHFCTDAFSAYADNTAAARLFSFFTQPHHKRTFSHDCNTTEVFVESIGSLRILRYFFQYSVFGMV